MHMTLQEKLTGWWTWEQKTVMNEPAPTATWEPKSAERNWRGGKLNRENQPK